MSTPDSPVVAAAPPVVAAAHGGAVRRGLGANVTALAASQAVTWSVTLVWTLVVPRLLGPAQMGMLVTGLATAAILGVLLGLPTRDFLAREMVSRPADAPALLGSVVVLRLCLVPVFFALTELYAWVAGVGPDARRVLLLCTGVTVCTLLAEPALAAFQAKERMENIALYEALHKLLQGLGGIALVLLGMHVIGLSAFHLVVAVGLVVFAVVRVQRLVDIEWRTRWTSTWSLVRASAPYWTFGVFYMVYLWIDSVLLGLLTPVHVVGWYGGATKLFTTLMFIPVILSTAWLPRLVRAFESSPQDLARTARVPVEAVLLLSLPICAGTLATADQVVLLLFGDGYANAGPVLAVLALCFPPMYLNILLYQVLIAQRRPGPWMRVMAAATVVNPALNLVLIPLAQERYANGALGAAWSLVLTEVMVVTAGIAIVGRHVITSEMAWRTARAGVAAALMCASMLAANQYGLWLSAPLGLAVFVTALLALRAVAPEQREAARAAVRALRRRIGRTRQQASA